MTVSTIKTKANQHQFSLLRSSYKTLTLQKLDKKRVTNKVIFKLTQNVRYHFLESSYLTQSTNSDFISSFYVFLVTNKFARSYQNSQTVH